MLLLFLPSVKRYWYLFYLLSLLVLRLSTTAELHPTADDGAPPAHAFDFSFSRAMRLGRRRFRQLGHA